MEENLKGRRILVVEDDQRAMNALRAAFAECGALALGPVTGVSEALRIIEAEPQLDGAVLDINLSGDTVFAVAEELTRRRIPFIFSAGPHRGNMIKLYEKPDEEPLDTEQIIGTLAARVSRRQQNGSARTDSLHSNRFLEMLPDEDRSLVNAALHRVEMKARDIIVEEGRPVPFVYFPETSVLSIMVASPDARPIEVAMIGREGFSDFAPYGIEHAYLRSGVLIGGTALQMRAEDLQALVLRRPAIQAAISSFKEALAIQFAYSALSHGTSTIDARIARWILMLHDRLAGDTIPVVHNLIADMLAVRRSGVTTALHVLEGLGAIKSVRGLIIIRDREQLRQLAGGTYGVPELEYARLMKRDYSVHA